MKFLSLKVLDVITFGTLKNFTAGESHYQQLEFPPPIMRFFSFGKDLKVLGVFLKKGEEVYMPVPADALSKRKGEGKTAYVPKFHQELNRPFLEPENGNLISLEQAKGFCSFRDFVEKYAKGEEFPLIDIDLRSEERTGVKLNYSLRTAEEHYLYSRLFLRLGEYSLILLVEGEHERVEYITVGGERRLAKLEEEKLTQVDSYTSQSVGIDRHKLYKFYATTHLYFDPEGEVRINGIRFNLEWVSSQEPEWVSGFNKPFLYMLKPATVLWLRAVEDGILRRICQISQKNGVLKLMERGWNSGILLEGT